MGRASLAIHHVVNHAKSDTVPYYTWVGPEGRKYISLPNRLYNNGMLLSNKSPIGALLATLHKDGDPPPHIIHNPRPNKTLHIGSHANIENTEDFAVTLWFIVNDMLIDPLDIDKSFQFYVLPGNTSDKEQKLRQKRFEYIKSKNYWDLWWDDNAGIFFIQIEEL